MPLKPRDYTLTEAARLIAKACPGEDEWVNLAAAAGDGSLPSYLIASEGGARHEIPPSAWTSGHLKYNHVSDNGTLKLKKPFLAPEPRKGWFPDSAFGGIWIEREPLDEAIAALALLPQSASHEQTPLPVILGETVDEREWHKSGFSPLDDAIGVAVGVHPRRAEGYGDKKREFDTLRQRAIGDILSGKLHAQTLDGTYWVERKGFLTWAGLPAVGEGVPTPEPEPSNEVLANRRGRGVPPVQRNAIKDEMLRRLQNGSLTPEDLQGMKEESLKAEFPGHAESRNPYRAARQEALSEFVSNSKK